MLPLSGEVKGQLEARAGGALKASRREDRSLSPQEEKGRGSGQPGHIGQDGSKS